MAKKKETVKGKVKKTQERRKAPKKKAPKKLTPAQRLQAEDKKLETEIKDFNKKDERGLSPRVLKFIKYYILCYSQKDAAIMAGFSVKSSESIACRLLQRPEVKKEIKIRIKGIVDRADEKIAKMIEHLCIDAYYNPLDIIDNDGSLIGDKESLGNLAHAIRGIETRPSKGGGEYTVIKLADKDRAREQLGKYLKMFTDKIELSGPGGTPLPAMVVNMPDGSFNKKDKT